MSTPPSCATLASSAFSRFFIVSRSWRIQMQRTPKGDTSVPRFFSSLAARAWPQAGWSSGLQYLFFRKWALMASTPSIWPCSIRRRVASSISSARGIRSPTRLWRILSTREDGEGASWPASGRQMAADRLVDSQRSQRNMIANPPDRDPRCDA